MPFPPPRHGIDQVVGRRSRAGTANPAVRRVWRAGGRKVDAKNVDCPDDGTHDSQTQCSTDAYRGSHRRREERPGPGDYPHHCRWETYRGRGIEAGIVAGLGGDRQRRELLHRGLQHREHLRGEPGRRDQTRATRRSSGLSFACCPFSANRGWAPGVTHFEVRPRSAKNPARGNTVSPATHPKSDKRRRVVGKQPRHRFLAITVLPTINPRG